MSKENLLPLGEDGVDKKNPQLILPSSQGEEIQQPISEDSERITLIYLHIEIQIISINNSAAIPRENDILGFFESNQQSIELINSTNFFVHIKETQINDLEKVLIEVFPELKEIDFKIIKVERLSESLWKVRKASNSESF